LLCSAHVHRLDAVKRGYVLVEMNERGHFFSEGDYDILAF
jgi:predicted acyl esterase